MDLAVFCEKEKHQIFTTLKFFSGAPGIPSISLAESSAQSYSFDLVWDVTSTYFPLINEVLYWEASKVCK